jgi:hypothetical protein
MIYAEYVQRRIKYIGKGDKAATIKECRKLIYKLEILHGIIHEIQDNLLKRI